MYVTAWLQLIVWDDDPMIWDGQHGPSVATSVIMMTSSNDESIMINYSEEQYFLMTRTDLKVVIFVGSSNS